MSDLGTRFDDIDLYKLLLSFEKRGFDLIATRSLRNLAHADLEGFVKVLSSWKSFRVFLSNHKGAEWRQTKWMRLRYLSLKKGISKYTSAVRYLMNFGSVSIHDSATGGEFSPYYVLGRDIPILVRVRVSIPELGANSLEIKFFSSGLISASVSIPTPGPCELSSGFEGNRDDQASNREAEQLAITTLKSKVEEMKRSILMKLQVRRPEFAFYYYDRYEVDVRDHLNHSEREAGNKSDSAFDGVFDLDGNRFLISKNRAVLCCGRLNDRVKRSIYLFEIALLQKYFLTTRDSYIDKYVRDYSISDRLVSLEKYLSDFLEMVKLFLFSKEEGGSHKLFSDAQFDSLYRKLHQSLGLLDLSAHVDRKIKDALSVFSLVSSIKREKAILYLTVFIAFVTLVLAVDLLLKAVPLIMKWLTQGIGLL